MKASRFSLYISKAAAARITGVPACRFGKHRIEGESVTFQINLGEQKEIKIHASYFYNDFHKTRKLKGEKLEVVSHTFRPDRNETVKDELSFWNVEGKEKPFYSVYPDEKGKLICECEDFKKQEEALAEPFCKHCWAVLKFEGWSYQRYCEKQQHLIPF